MAQQKVSLDEALLTLSEGLSSRAKNPGMDGYKPHAKQELFHKSEDYVRLYIGGNRAGKTHGGVMEDLWWALGEHPYVQTPPPPVRIRVVVVDFTEGLHEIMMPKFKQLVRKKDLRGGSWDKAYDKQLRKLTFKNGSEIQFMSYEQDLEKFAGTSQHLIHFDEEPPQHIYNECAARVIDTNGRMMITMTPVEGITWVFEDLYKKTEDAQDVEVIVERTDIIGKVFRSNAEEVTVIEVGMNENPHLSESAQRRFLKTLNDEEGAARSKGTFVAVGGKVFKSFERATHTIPQIDRPYSEIFAGCAIYTSTDHGWNNPTAWLWHAVFASGRVITFHEHYASEMTVAEHARIVREFEEKHGLVVDVRTGDPAMGQHSGITGSSVLMEYASHGLPIYTDSVPKDPKIGIEKMQQYFRIVEETGTPTWQITENCVNFISELANLQWQKYESRKLQFKYNKQEQVLKKNDHAFDSAKYFATFLPDLRPDLPPAPPIDLKRYNGLMRYDELMLRQAERSADSTQWETLETFN